MPRALLLTPRRLLLIACLLLSAAVAPVVLLSGGEDSAIAEPSPSAVVVQLHQSGGYVGVDIRMSVRGTRGVTVPQRGGTVRRHTLRPGTLTALRRALDAAHLEQELPVTQTGCADCFVYEIRYRGHRVRFDDSSVPGRMAKVLAELRRIAAGGR